MVQSHCVCVITYFAFFFIIKPLQIGKASKRMRERETIKTKQRNEVNVYHWRHWLVLPLLRLLFLYTLLYTLFFCSSLKLIFNLAFFISLFFCIFLTYPYWISSDQCLLVKSVLYDLCLEVWVCKAHISFCCYYCGEFHFTVLTEWLFKWKLFYISLKRFEEVIEIPIHWFRRLSACKTRKFYFEIILKIKKISAKNQLQWQMAHYLLLGTSLFSTHVNFGVVLST